MRIQKLCQWVKERGLDALILEHPSDLFYLTSLWFSTARLIVYPADGACLLVDGRYYEQAKRAHPSCKVVLAKPEALAAALEHVRKAGVDGSMSLDRFEAMKKAVPQKQWVPISRPLKEFRGSKDPDEVAALKRAALLTRQGYQHILQHLKEGISETELALEFEIFCKKKGALGLSFEPIIAFGENSAYPHHRAGRDRLTKNQSILIDIGAVVDQYRGDMTRVFFWGEPLPELKQLYQLAQNAHDRAVAALRPGIPLGELDRIVHSYFSEEGVESLFTHGLGHGIGLETHEYPSVRADGEDRDLLIQPGMVFTIEPGLYRPGIGGVRYENTFLVTADGSENLYAGL